MSNLFADISPDLSSYLNTDELIQLSFISTSSFFYGLNNLKFKRNIPSEVEVVGLLDILNNTEVFNRKEILREIKKLKEVNIKDGLERTIFHKIVINDHVGENTDILEILENMGANVNSQDYEGNTPILAYLMLRRYNVEANVIESLLYLGSDITIENKYEDVPYFIANNDTLIQFYNSGYGNYDNSFWEVVADDALENGNGEILYLITGEKFNEDGSFG